MKVAKPQKLTASVIKKLVASNNSYKVWDTEIKGYFVRVSPKGKVSFCYFYRHDGEARDYTIGPLGKLTADIGRSEAKQIAAQTARGIDVQALKKQKKTEAHRHQQARLGHYIATHYASYVTTHLRGHKEQLRVLNKVFGFLHDLPMNRIKKQRLIQWQSEQINKGLKPATINRRLAILKATLSHAVESECIDEHPLKGLKRLKDDPIKRVRYLSDTEETGFRQALLDRQHEQRTKRVNYIAWQKQRHLPTHHPLNTRFTDYLMPMVLLAINTGLRRGELFNLAWEHINFDTKILTVIGEESKGLKTRFVYLNQEAATALLDWLSDKKGHGLVFPSPSNGARLDNINKSWRNLIERAGIENFRFHDLRHHFASQLVMNGIDLFTVKELLGHADIETTMIYAHLSPDHKAKGVCVLDSRTNGITATLSSNADVLTFPSVAAGR